MTRRLACDVKIYLFSYLNHVVVFEASTFSVDLRQDITNSRHFLTSKGLEETRRLQLNNRLRRLIMFVATI